MGIKPRHNRKSPRGWFSLFLAAGGVWAILATCVLLCATGLSIFALNTGRAFDERGVTVMATIVSKRETRSGDSKAYHVTLAYPVSGRVITANRKVKRGFYNRVKEGSETEIRYLYGDPRQFEHYVGERRDTSQHYQFAAGVAGLIGLGLLWVYGMRANRGVLARRWGHRTTATIERFVERKNSGRPIGKGYMIWRLADGRRGESLDRNIRELERLGAGTQIIVYVRKGDSWWEGDVGPRVYPDSRLPKV